MKNNKDLKYAKQFKEPNIPKTYEQFILEEKNLDQQDLYPDLDYQDISKQKGCGPCTISGCYHPDRCFYLEVGFWKILLFGSSPDWAFKRKESEFQSLVMSNVEEAREVVKKLKNGDYEVIARYETNKEERARNKKEVVMSKIRSYIVSHERGNNVHEAHLDLSSIDSIESIPEESSDQTSGFPWRRDSDWNKGSGRNEEKWFWERDSSSKKSFWEK